MVSRRTRSYKDKRPAGIFGQFMLPLAVIMAIALLYFSIKLFFLNSGDQRRNTTAVAPAVVSADAPQPVQAVPAEPPAPQTPPATAAKPPKIVAGPVGDQTAKPTPPAATPATPPATAAKPPAKPTQTTPPAATAKPPASTPSTPVKPAAVKRYDVQIGAFSARDNAVQLVQKVRAQGYEVYVNEPESADPPYRVRVKGPADRSQAESLSVKLQEQGYPVYIVAIN